MLVSTVAFFRITSYNVCYTKLLRLFYLLVYAFMNMGAFGIVMLIAQKEDEGYEIAHMKGIGFRYPALGALLTLFLVSLGGIPPTAGFVGKFYLFSAAVKNGYIWLAVIGVLNSAASIYYYSYNFV